MRPFNRYQQSKLDAAFRRAFREYARSQQKSYCAYCDERLTAATCTADHVQARAVFGLDHRNNIVAACEPCNKLKGLMPAATFNKLIREPLTCHGIPAGQRVPYMLAWSRNRINKRLRLMEKNLGVAA